MSFFRSQEMVLCQLFLQSEAAYACVSELGELGVVQFKDLNPNVNAFQRRFVNEIRRCEEMERKLRYAEKEIRKEKLVIADRGENPKAPAPKEMVDLEATFEKIEGELKEVNTNNEALKRNFQELSELKEVMLKTQYFFQTHTGDFHNIVDTAQYALAHDEVGFVPITQAGAVQLGFVAGVIPREKMPGFERLLWFACRGNVFLRYEEISHPMEDPLTGEPVHKDVFIIFFQGEQLKSKVKKICDGFKASLYPCPENPQEREEMLKGVNTRLADLKTVLSQTDDHRHRVLVATQKEIRSWIIKVEKIKAIYHTLNMFTFAQNSLIAECWCPLSAREEVNAALRAGEKVSGSTIPSIVQTMQTKKKPPTFFKTNKFTNGFQNIVNAYGVATYLEVNPALYTIITFPFLFAIMFGDAGHGVIMFLFGLWMVLTEKKHLAQRSTNEIWNTFFGGRYIILLMGLFSVYTGMIYNDIFSKSFNIFGSAWRMHDYSDEFLHHIEDQKADYMLDPLNFFRNQTPYPVGIDPIWQPAKNKIAFLNSLKMKLAVIFGISQMFFGICLSLFNHLYFRKYLHILVEFIPECIFLLFLFGYLVAIIFYKWVTFGTAESTCAPALLIHYINMFMMSAKNKPAVNSTDYLTKKDCTQWVFYSGQKELQTAFVILAVLSVPVLLLVIPFVERAKHKAKLRHARSVDALIPNEVSEAIERTSSGHSPKVGTPRGQVNPAFQSDEQKAANPHPEEQTVAAEPAPTLSVNMSVADIKPGSDDNVRSVNSDGAHSSKAAVASHDDDDEEEFEFGEVFIHQAIHTIEFCLGCISHTASYLRLWALSLAHAQLSEVLWTMVFSLGLKMDLKNGAGGIVIVALWFAWANLTVAVLLMMEGLSAFLHTLRLHWVEFQSKFYKGEGYLFIPFGFKEILKLDSLEDLK